MYRLDVTNLEKNDVHYQSKYFSFFLVIFSATWLISVISAIKTVCFFGITLTGGFLIFPITMLLNTLIVDIYGYKGARQAIWYGTAVNLSYIFFIHLVDLMPASPSWRLESEFKAILIPQTRIIFASVISFWTSAFLNNYLMAKLKNSGKSVFQRIIISSYLSITMDLLIYFTLGFLGTVPVSIFRKLFLFAYFKKLICEILLLPFTWKVIDKVKRAEGFELYDLTTNFTPFSLNNIYRLSDYKLVNKGNIEQKNAFN